jgi:hypothetical protein
MPYFKNSNGKLFWLDQGDDPAIWLPDCAPISDAEAKSICAAEDSQITYAQKRATEYPDFRDYLDGVVKGDQAQIDAYIAACLAVKAKYPKPE